MIKEMFSNSLSALVVTRRCFQSRRDRLYRQLDEFIKLFLYPAESSLSFLLLVNTVIIHIY